MNGFHFRAPSSYLSARRVSRVVHERGKNVYAREVPPRHPPAGRISHISPVTGMQMPECIIGASKRNGLQARILLRCTRRSGNGQRFKHLTKGNRAPAWLFHTRIACRNGTISTPDPRKCPSNGQRQSRPRRGLLGGRRAELVLHEIGAAAHMRNKRLSGRV
jgi:hypothetical protein